MSNLTPEEITEQEQGYEFAFYSRNKNFYLLASLIAFIISTQLVMFLREQENGVTWMVVTGLLVGSTILGILWWRQRTNSRIYRRHRDHILRDVGPAEPLNLFLSQATQEFTSGKNYILTAVRIILLAIGGVNLMLLFPAPGEAITLWNWELIFAVVPIILAMILSPIIYTVRKKELATLTDSTFPE